MWLNYFKDTEETVCEMAYAGFCQRGSLLSLSTGSEIRGYQSGIRFKLAASQSSSEICCAVAVGKIETDRLVSQIILASVVNAEQAVNAGV